MNDEEKKHDDDFEEVVAPRYPFLQFKEEGETRAGILEAPITIRGMGGPQKVYRLRQDSEIFNVPSYQVLVGLLDLVEVGTEVKILFVGWEHGEHDYKVFKVFQKKKPPF